MRRHRAFEISTLLSLGAALLPGCDRFSPDDAIEDLVESEVLGHVVDNRGEPVAGVRIQLFDLADNPEFVEGSDVAAVQAYIDREAVLASTNALTSAETYGDGRFSITDAPASAFLATATIAGCTAGFAGFDEDTGILSLETLIEPSFDDGLKFSIPDFVVACAAAPEVGPEGNSDAAPPFDPPVAAASCDAETCTAAGGACESDACVLQCSPEACGESGGTCSEGQCLLPLCNADACAGLGGSCEADVCVLAAACVQADCAAASGTCSEDGTTCEIPPCLAAEADCAAAGGACSADGLSCELAACRSDAECSAGQPGAFCADPGDVALAECRPPAPGELVAPSEALGFTGLRVTDVAGNVIADASAGNEILDVATLADRLVRVQADYDGADTDAFLHVQSGSQLCPELPPTTDSIPIRIEGGAIVSDAGDFLELSLTGGYQKLQLSTSEIAGEPTADGQSFTIEVGDAMACAPPADPFIATLSWDAGPGEPADLDLSIWNAAGELVFVGSKQAAWGQLALEAKGPGPEVFVATDAAQGPFTVKVTFFSGKPRDIAAKLRIQRSVGGVALDDTFTVNVAKPKDVAEAGVFSAG
jgi:hypothetical protein